MPLTATQRQKKTKAFLAFRENPNVALFEMVWELREEILPRLVDEGVARVKDEAKTQLVAGALKALKEALSDDVPGLVLAGVKAEIGALKTAQDGYSPKRGVDYYTKEDRKQILRDIMKLVKIPEPKPGEPGKDGKTPKAGKDYATKAQTREMVEEVVGRLLAGMGPSDAVDKNALPAIASEIVGKLDFKARAAEIARALETLKDTGEALDYYALRNRPGTKAYDEGKTERRGLVRGGRGGTEPLYYDLSDELDGVTKTFTIPANKRVLGVWGTQFPQAYRPGVDWSRTTTSLTLGNDVSAPEAGQTLYILYSPL